MRSEQLDLKIYDSSKVECGFLHRYDQAFASLVDAKVNLLEIGVDKGGSLLLWQDYFPKGTIVGIDMKAPAKPIAGERIHFFEGKQEDVDFLTEVSELMAPEGFDIVIDDASHVAEMARASFWHLFDSHLKPGGLYCIEDWGTGYWCDWPDGRSYDPPHNYGMVGFLKELVDEVGATDLSMASLAGESTRMSKFDSLQLFPALALVKKPA